MARSSRGSGNMASLWKKAREETKNDSGGEFIQSDVGNHRMQIVQASLGDFGGARKLMTKWACIDEETKGQLNTEFQQVDDAERLVWLQRQLINLGVDVDEVEIENEDDILKVYEEMIEDRVVARVRITEKDEYKNMRVQRAIEVEEDELLDPKKAKSGSSSSAKGSDKKKGKEEEEKTGDEFDVGDKVVLKDGSKGEIVEFTEDDDAVVKVDGKRKTQTVSLDDLEFQEEGDGEGDDDEPAIEDQLFNGAKIEFEDDGETFKAKVKSMNKRKKEVTIRVDGEKEDETIEFDMITKVIGSRKEADDDDGDDAGDGLEFDVGDEVEFKVGRKKTVGTIKSIDDEVANVKVDGERKLQAVALDKLAHVVE